MAEIRIVRKTPVVLPWLIGLGLVLLVAALWVAGGTYGAGVVSDSVPPQQFLPREPAAALPADVAAYQQFAGSPGPPSPGPSHEYTATGIRRLVAALVAVAAADTAGNGQLSQKLTMFQEQADRLQRDPQSFGHADIVRAVFIAAADVIGSLHEARPSAGGALNDDVAELRRSAESLDSSQPLLDQDQKVRYFFSRSANVLAMLAEGYPANARADR